jgi:hypothetical protein
MPESPIAYSILETWEWPVRGVASAHFRVVVRFKIQ